MTRNEQARERELTASRVYSANIRAEIARRKATELRQTDVAAAIGLTESAWNRRIGGRVPWRASELEAVARELGVPLGTLTGGAA